MRFFFHPLLALEAWAMRRTAWLNHPAAPLRLALFVPLLCGLLSLAMGQDDGWDMRNYHLYNVYALFNDRIGLDLAPGRFQSYFNPTLDIPYYLLTRYCPAPVAGFAFGALHGLIYVLLFAIARELLGRARQRAAILLALGGTLAGGFLSELGNSMGDDTTALLVLWALYVLLHHWQRWRNGERGGTWRLLAAGVLAGAAAGLKLTNAVYALALCLPLLAVPVAFLQRIRLAFLFGVGVLGGLAATAGWWMLKMWQMFGNPLFPQFNNIFHSPWALEHGVIDTYFRPKNLSETLLWPFIFTRDVSRVAEVPVKLVIWPLAYMLALALVCSWLVQVLRRRPAAAALDERKGFVFLFFCFAYLIWMELFSIYRYIVPIEVLAPLVIWILVERLLLPGLARRVLAAVLSVIVLSALPFTTWGHAQWAERAFTVQPPVLEKPAAAIVFIASPEPPLAWLAEYFPRETVMVGLGTGFPEGPAYRQRWQSYLDQRPGPHYALLAGAKNDKDSSLKKKRLIADALGLTDSAAGCARLDGWLKRVRFQVDVKYLAQPSARHCTLELQPRYQMDIAAIDRGTIATSQQHLLRYGLQLDGASCQLYSAQVGADPHPYQLCRVTPLPR
ncbi:glycosyltransferase 87 family protein [Massilia sp. MB5]|uniref:glycosyltransferase 87 family protein n=1 Tax=Massilia sp. MB5 TaxID=2919578 RepID=UPI001F109B07|nr:glycosyltransferase 87 family protein [Massilia sp. MB5]UMR32494.1 glycosyltransferase 87 family protein [Massilia sp. MB5]